MTSKEATYQYRLAQWAELAKERGELGLNIRAFCALKGYAENTYFYWQRRLRNVAYEEPLKQRPGSESLVPTGWTAIAETKAEPEKSVTIEVGGCRINVGADTDTDLLAKVVRALKST
jgi:putative transposase